MDIVLTMVNEAHDAASFRTAALIVQNHIRSGREPEITHALLVGLSMRGHYLITQGHPAQPISQAVMQTLNTEPERKAS